MFYNLNLKKKKLEYLGWFFGGLLLAHETLRLGAFHSHLGRVEHFALFLMFARVHVHLETIGSKVSPAIRTRFQIQSLSVGVLCRRLSVKVLSLGSTADWHTIKVGRSTIRVVISSSWLLFTRSRLGSGWWCHRLGLVLVVLLFISIATRTHRSPDSPRRITRLAAPHVNLQSIGLESTTAVLTLDQLCLGRLPRCFIHRVQIVRAPA